MSDFAFNSGTWLGEGKISFSSSTESLKFYTKWEIKEKNPTTIEAVQTVEIDGVEERQLNSYTFTTISPHSFTVTLVNPLLGTVSGEGFRDSKRISWEYRNQDDFQGFEAYEKKENGDYILYAEFGTDQLRTIIEGVIHHLTRKVSESSPFI